jgi:hypothetical protein
MRGWLASSEPWCPIVQGSDGKQYLIAGFEEGDREEITPGGYLNVVVTDVTMTGKDPLSADSVNATTHFTTTDASGNALSSDLCAAVDRMRSAGRDFPKDTVPYGRVLGPNSNSVARYIGTQGGSNPTGPLDAVNWSVRIPRVERR